MEENIKEEIIKPKKSLIYIFVFRVLLIAGILFIVSNYLFASPLNSKNATLHISSRDSLTKISENLINNNVIKNKFIFKSLVYFFSGDRNIHNGDYLFKKGSSVIAVSWQISRGRHDVLPLRVTFREGMTNNEMADVLAQKISVFRRDLFISDPRSKQGYLFPDTYYFFSLSTTDEILNDMSSNFENRINPLKKSIKDSGHSIEEIIIMASILEKEASGKDDIGVISGILWKRIKLGMPLQVDVAESTYRKSGLPEVAIGNPGFLAIKAAISPVNSPYLFYLHDDGRQVHYAVDFSQHRSNIARYLK